MESKQDAVAMVQMRLGETLDQDTQAQKEVCTPQTKKLWKLTQCMR